MSDQPKERPISAPPKPPADSSADAAALLLLNREREQAAVLQADLEDDSKWQYYVRCYRCDQTTHKHHIGVFLTCNPRGRVLTQNEFFASYKNRNDPWWDDVFCQECYRPDEDNEPLGERFGLQVMYAPSIRKRGVMFSVPPDHLFRYAKDPVLAKKIGPHRAERVAYRSGNEHFTPRANEMKEAVRG